MFHPEKIQNKLQYAWEHLNNTVPELFPEGSKLVRHSIASVLEANAQLNALLGEDGNLVRPYNQEEIRWIRNERAICANDFLYWATRYAYIQDWTGDYILFSPNLAQKIVLEVMADMEFRDIAILLMVHKARQLGVTTLSELIMLWRTMFIPGAETLVASSRPDKTPLMVAKMGLAYERMPYWMRPETITNNSTTWGFDNQKSFFHFKHGAMMSDMGRGSTITSFHLSEVSEYTNAKEAIDASLLRAAHDSPWLLGILESTGKGREGWWKVTWDFSVDYYPRGMSRLCPVFLPWYIATDLYPNEAWLRAHPVPSDWIPEERTTLHAKKATEYVQSGQNRIVTEELGTKWVMPKSQMWYWEVERKAFESKKDLHLFYQEMCATPEEGFQSPNGGVFDADFIFRKRDQCPMPYGVYGIACNEGDIPKQHQVREEDIDRSLPPINITANWAHNQPKHQYTLYPLLHRGPTPFSPLGKILMYEPPRSEKVYAGGTDTGFGVGQDRSVISIVRKGDQFEGDKQVCEFASPQLNSFQLWPFNLALGTLYSVPYNGKLRQMRQVIEGAANGENVYNELKKRGWVEFHNWIRYNKKRVLEANANMQLWYTNAWSRPLMLDMLFDAVQEEWLDISSPWLVDELGTLELNAEKQKILAAANEHDDRVMATGIALFSLHATETKHNDMWRSRVSYQKPSEITYAKYNPGYQGSAPDAAHPMNSYIYDIKRD